MTLSREFVTTWQNRKTTYDVATLAKRIDPKVNIERSNQTTYNFTDGSIARTEGKGRHFKIWCYE